MDSLPLAAHEVVGQVVEHAVDAVAAQHHIVLRRALCEQCSIDIDTRVAMEIEGGAFGDGKRSSLLHGQSAVDDEGLVAGGDDGVVADDGVAQDGRIP